MRRLFAALVVATLVAGPAAAEPKLKRYKVVTADGGESLVAGTRISVQGVFVLIWIGRTLDTVVTAPKYVTEIPEGTPEPEPAPAPEGLPMPLDPRTHAPTVALGRK